MTTKATKQKFAKISEWISAGNMASGWYLMEGVERETEKAVAFKAARGNAYGYLTSCMCWLPRSQMQEAENDFYVNGEARMFLVPDWLLRKKESEGFVF